MPFALFSVGFNTRTNKVCGKLRLRPLRALRGEAVHYLKLRTTCRVIAIPEQHPPPGTQFTHVADEKLPEAQPERTCNQQIKICGRMSSHSKRAGEARAPAALRKAIFHPSMRNLSYYIINIFFWLLSNICFYAIILP
jgi:hypothetical protein